MIHRQGVDRFAREAYPGLADHFVGLAESQAPSTLFVTCSDSRVDPSLITQTQPGELFVLRNVGNMIPAAGHDTASAAVVEYAVTVLGVERIVVCGHSNCGAMNGLLNPQSIAHLDAVAPWVEHAAAVRTEVAELPAEQQWDAAIRANVAHQIELLKTHPSVVEALASGQLGIEGWLYDIGEGRVELITEVAPPSPESESE